MVKRSILLLALGFLGCDLVKELNFKSSFELKYWVDAFQDQCPSQPNKQCLRVKIGNNFNPDDPWTVIEYKINNFDYSPRYIYELLVKVDTYPQPQSNGSYIQYTLLRLISKKEVQSSSSKAVDSIYTKTKNVLALD